MAIDEFNAKGGVLGRKIEWITADTETNAGDRHAASPSASSRREECAFLIGALHSGVANAITQVANKYGTIYLNTNSSAPSEAGENCSRVKFVWDGNGTNFSKAAVQNAVERHRQELAAADQRLRLGPHHVGGDQGAGRSGRRQDHRQSAGAAEHARLHLLSAEDPAGKARRRGDRGRRRRHQGAAPAGQLSSSSRQDRPGSTTSRIGPISGARPTRLFGVFGTTWYHKLPLPGVAEFVKRWQTAYPQDRRSRCRATSPTTATWRRANCCVRSSGPARPTTMQDHQGA